MLQLTGRLVFAPDRGVNFRKTNKLSTLLIEFDKDDISRYYSAQIQQRYGPWCNLMPPMFGLHATVLRGNADRFNEAIAKRMHNRRVSVTFDPCTLTRTKWLVNGSVSQAPGFWFMKAVGEELAQLRREAEASCCPYRYADGTVNQYMPHLTIAREGENYMHVKPRLMRTNSSRLVLRLAKRCLAQIPVRTGHLELAAELEAFVKSFKLVQRQTAGADLTKLVYNYIKLPNHGQPMKEWERAILEMFETKELIS